jgi:hypothetical protein
VAAPFGNGGNASVLLQLIGGEGAIAWFAEGDEETRGKDGASAWERVKYREVGMALGAWCHGRVEILARLQGHAEVGDEGLDQAGIGGDDARIGSQRGGALDGVEAWGDHISVAHVRVAEKALQGGASRQLHGLEGRPWGEDVAADGGVFVVEPWQGVRQVVFQGTRETIREAHVVTDPTAAMFHELFAGAHGGTLGLKGLELIAMLAQEFKLERGVRGVGLGPAECKGFARPRPRQGVDGKAHEEVILSPRRDEGPLMEFEADGHRLPFEPCTQGAHPLVDGVRLVFEDAELACLGACRLQADIVCGIGPVDADEGRTRIRR